MCNSFFGVGRGGGWVRKIFIMDKPYLHNRDDLIIPQSLNISFNIMSNREGNSGVSYFDCCCGY